MDTETGKARAPAKYKIFSGGVRRYAFYCDLSGMLVCAVNAVAGASPEEELRIAWDEAKRFFNFCPKCGRNVCNEMFNADRCECVDCAPWVKPPAFCSVCGAKLGVENSFCVSCGSRIQKEGVDEDAGACE